MSPALDTQPRRDGWVEHQATWEEVTVGTVLAEPERRTTRWEIVEVAHGMSVKFGYTLWMRAREQTSGEMRTITPQFKTNPVRVLTQDPRSTSTPPPTEPTDAEAVMTLVRELGAEVMARRDNHTGEVVCPDYLASNHLGPDGTPKQAFLEHLRIAHALDVSDDLSVVDRHTLHTQAHDPRWPNIGKGGFPHRHVPEDLSLY